MKVYYRVKKTPEQNIIPYSYNIANALEGALQLGLECIPYFAVKEIYEALDMPYGYNKPSGMMLVYPVISADPTFGHMGSFCNLLGSTEPAQDLLDAASIEKNVTPEACPAYIVHTSNDEIVNVKNSLALANAYAEAGMTFELHIYPDGPHGMALANRITECGNAKWVDECFACWVENAVKWAEKFGV